MDPLRWKRIGELFEAARLLNGERRIAFLKENCAQDDDLFQQVKSLCDIDDQPGLLDSKPARSTLGIPQIVAGRFRIIRYIAEGGMGTVYEAEDLQLRDHVALKTIRPDVASNPQAVERFKQEIRLGKRVTHHNVCRIHDLGTDRADDGTEFLFLTMQFLSGETLASRIQRGPVPQSEALPLINDMADALEAAHREEVIHRDFKSGNVMLVQGTNRPYAVVTDFGLARGSREGGSLTRWGLIGTVDYMAPEQIVGSEITPATDIYAFGVVMYEMVTGRLPFASDAKGTVLQKHLNDEPEPPKNLTPNLDASWNEAILGCLRKIPSERFQSAEEVKEALVQGGDKLGPRHTIGRQQPEPVGLKKWTIPYLLRRPFWLVTSALALIVIFATGWRLLHRDPTPERLATERQITFVPLGYRLTSGAISPDGRVVAYHDQTGVYVRSIDSGETHTVQLPSELVGRLFQVRWFPAGDKLIADASSPQGWDLWEINLLGDAEPKLLFRNGGDPAVSPDGQTIAFTNSEYGKGSREIWLGGANGGVPTKLVDAQPDNHLMSPSWSPDGRWLAYGRNSQTSVAIMVRPASGGTEIPAVTNSTIPSPYKLHLYPGGGNLTWCRDGRLVFAVADHEPDHSSQTHHSLWSVLMDPNSGRSIGPPVRLTADNGIPLFNLTCAASGNRLSVLKNQTWVDVYVADLDADGINIKPPRRLTLDNRGSGFNAWTSDSRAVLFTSDRNGKDQIFRQAIDADAAEAVVWGPSEVAHARVTPDGEWLLYVETESEGKSPRPGSPVSWLMRKPTAGGAPEKLMQVDDGVDIHCATNPKGVPECVLSYIDGGQMTFYALDPQQGKGRQLAEVPYYRAQMAGGRAWSICSDGSQIALLNVDPQSSRIDIIATSDGTSKKLLLEPDIGRPQSISWAANGEGFYLTSRGTGGFSLLYVTLAGKPRTIWRTNHGQWMADPTPSPDGKHLAFIYQSYDDNLWLVDNF